MSIRTKSLITNLQGEVQKLEARHGKEVPATAIRNPALRELAKPVSTGCAGTAVVRTDQLKTALKTVGKDIQRADANKDGRLNVGDQKRLSPLAARMLQAAGKDVAVAQDDPPARPSVSSGCGGGSPSISVPPERPWVAPRPVSTGCGGSAPAPIRTGC